MRYGVRMGAHEGERRSEDRTLPAGQTAAQLPAGFLSVCIRGFVEDQAIFVIELGGAAALAPLPHPLAVSPAVRAEQSDFLAGEGALQSGEPECMKQTLAQTRPLPAARHPWPDNQRPQPDSHSSCLRKSLPAPAKPRCRRHPARLRRCIAPFSPCFRFRSSRRLQRGS